MKRAKCNAIGCGALILDTQLFCARHLVMLESDTRRVLGKLFRPGKKYQSESFRDTLEVARREILYFQTNGHAIPKDRPFKWDDEKGTQA